MAQPYIGEIRMFAGNFPPVGWMFCDGQLIPISENEALFNLIGTTYGGDGQENFALPNLQSRVPIHMGSNAGVTYQLAEMAGVEQVTLTTQQIPVHNHALLGSTGNGSQANPNNNVLASSTLVKPYAAETPGTTMAASSIGPAGGSQPHDNMQPFQCINYIISLFGIFPQQN
jgi:microcystin-dependent protein